VTYGQLRKIIPGLIALVIGLAVHLNAQTHRAEFDIANTTTLEIVNLHGRVDVVAVKEAAKATVIAAASSAAVTETEIKVENSKGRLRVTVIPAMSGKRIDLSIQLPERSRVRITTRDGEIGLRGNFESVEAISETGTIAADLPTDELKYEFQWTSSKPRFVADFELEPVKERSGGRFVIKGTYKKPVEEKPNEEPIAETETAGNGSETATPEEPIDVSVAANFTTARGIVLLNVPENEVSSDLRERPLTNAAKAIVRSGDSILMAAIRRSAPKYFGEYATSLPPAERTPRLTVQPGAANTSRASVKVASVRVTDTSNRAVPGITASDLDLFEAGKPLEILSVRPITTKVNLVLLLDVSGSVDNYVNFIRKAARSFIETVGPNDRTAIVLFNEDVKVLSDFTSDKATLSKSLDSFDAGGSTAYYDALAYTLADTLRPLRGERTAIVVLTDGDDNRSFLAFDSLAGAIEESGALIYPLYVPTGLVAASEASAVAENIDPLRNRHLTLTSKANAEGPQLAKLSGGVYYPINRLSQIQAAYDDIVLQLRTAYDITFRSAAIEPGNRTDPRLRVRMKKPGQFATIESISVSN
jgi:VWFA-related protein